MAKIKYLALLRGINVGGNNIIRMSALKEEFEKAGFADVSTYIQSGNVIFTAPSADKGKLVKKIEALLSEKFAYEARIVLISREEVRAAMAEAPEGFGSEPEKYKYDVIFLKDPLTSEEAMKSVTLKEGVDRADAGKFALYFSRLRSMDAQSRLGKIVTTPLYKNTTIRNWNTASKLLALMERE